MTELKRMIAESVRAIRQIDPLKPKIGIVLGTGLGGLSKKLKVSSTIPNSSIPHFPTTSIDGHAGEIVLGTLSGKAVIALSGRYHYFEGYSMQEITFPVRVAKALGIKTLVVSNSCGGLNPQFSTGDLMVITDHINFMGDNPLIGPNDDSLGPRFPDMIEPYTASLIELAEAAAIKRGIRLQRGVYLACAGPCLETRAEYRMMRALGADAVGMSTVPEVIVAVHAGLKVLGFSAITDECLPDALEPVNIDKIIETANRVEPILSALVADCIGKMK